MLAAIDYAGDWAAASTPVGVKHDATSGSPGHQGRPRSAALPHSWAACLRFAVEHGRELEDERVVAHLEHSLLVDNVFNLLVPD